MPYDLTLFNSLSSPTTENRVEDCMIFSAFSFGSCQRYLHDYCELLETYVPEDATLNEVCGGLLRAMDLKFKSVYWASHRNFTHYVAIDISRVQDSGILNLLDQRLKGPTFHTDIPPNSFRILLKRKDGNAPVLHLSYP